MKFETQITGNSKAEMQKQIDEIKSNYVTRPIEDTFINESGESEGITVSSASKDTPSVINLTYYSQDGTKHSTQVSPECIYIDDGTKLDKDGFGTPSSNVMFKSSGIQNTPLNFSVNKDALHIGDSVLATDRLYLGAGDYIRPDAIKWGSIIDVTQKEFRFKGIGYLESYNSFKNSIDTHQNKINELETWKESTDSSLQGAYLVPKINGFQVSEDNIFFKGSILGQSKLDIGVLRANLDTFTYKNFILDENSLNYNTLKVTTDDITLCGHSFNDFYAATQEISTKYMIPKIYTYGTKKAFADSSKTWVKFAEITLDKNQTCDLTFLFDSSFTVDTRQELEMYHFFARNNATTSTNKKYNTSLKNMSDNPQNYSNNRIKLVVINVPDTTQYNFSLWMDLKEQYETVRITVLSEFNRDLPNELYLNKTYLNYLTYDNIDDNLMSLDDINTIENFTEAISPINETSETIKSLTQRIETLESKINTNA